MKMKGKCWMRNAVDIAKEIYEQQNHASEERILMFKAMYEILILKCVPMCHLHVVLAALPKAGANLVDTVVPGLMVNNKCRLLVVVSVEGTRGFWGRILINKIVDFVVVVVCVCVQ